MSKPKNQDTDKRVKDKNMNVKFPEDDYKELQKIADDLGGLSLASMIRTLTYFQLEKVRKSGDPKEFLNIKK